MNTATRTYRITDTTTGDEAANVEAWDIAETIRPWYQEPPSEVEAAIVALQDALVHAEPSEEFEAFLALTVVPESHVGAWHA